MRPSDGGAMLVPSVEPSMSLRDSPGTTAAISIDARPEPGSIWRTSLQPHRSRRSRRGALAAQRMRSTVQFMG